MELSLGKHKAMWILECGDSFHRGFFGFLFIQLKISTTASKLVKRRVIGEQFFITSSLLTSIDIRRFHVH